MCSTDINTPTPTALHSAPTLSATFHATMKDVGSESMAPPTPALAPAPATAPTSTIVPAPEPTTIFASTSQKSDMKPALAVPANSLPVNRTEAVFEAVLEAVVAAYYQVSVGLIVEDLRDKSAPKQKVGPAIKRSPADHAPDAGSRKAEASVQKSHGQTTTSSVFDAPTQPVAAVLNPPHASAAIASINTLPPPASTHSPSTATPPRPRPSTLEISQSPSYSPPALLLDPQELMVDHWLPSHLDPLKCIVGNLKRCKHGTLFQWQAECMKAALQNKKHFIYSAPTSAGKSMVSELLAFRTVAMQSTAQGPKKVLFLFPFVAIAGEKLKHLTNLTDGTSLRVEDFSGGNGRRSIDDVDIAVCTYEKANNIVNKLLMEDALEQIGMVVVDELHMVGEAGRGSVIEVLLSKIMRAREPIRIVGMSATLPNMPEIRSWLDNANYYETEFRPIPLHKFACINGDLMQRSDETGEFVKIRSVTATPTLAPMQSASTGKGKKQGPTKTTISDGQAETVCLCRETAMQGHGVLIFASTKARCENIVRQIAKDFKQEKICYDSIINFGALQGHVDRLKSIEQTAQCIATGKKPCECITCCLSQGVAWHHAGLVQEQREAIEDAFRSGAVKVLVATTTLSSGVNLPARRVIIRAPVNWRGDPIEPSTYQQMAGRAGRTGHDTVGESIVICEGKDAAKHAETALKLLGGKLDRLESQVGNLGDDQNKTPLKFARAILEAIGTQLVTRTSHLSEYVANHFLLSVQNQHVKARVQQLQQKAFEYLLEHKFVRCTKDRKDTSVERLVATKLGKATISSCFDLNVAIRVHADLMKAKEKLSLDTELHLVYLCTPFEGLQVPDLQWSYFAGRFGKLGEKDSRVAEAVGASEGTLNVLARGSKVKAKENEQILTRFYFALLLLDLVQEKPARDACEMYGLSNGAIEKLQKDASQFAGFVTVFCNKLNEPNLELLFAQFQDRLIFGVERVLLELINFIPTIKPAIARILFNVGLESVEQIAKVASEDIQFQLSEAKYSSEANCAALAAKISIEANEAHIHLKAIEHGNLKGGLLGIGGRAPSTPSGSVRMHTQKGATSTQPASLQYSQYGSSNGSSNSGSRPTNTQSFDTIFPCGSRDVFNMFVEEWRRQPSWSFSLDLRQETLTETALDGASVLSEQAISVLAGVSIMWEEGSCWYVPLHSTNHPFHGQCVNQEGTFSCSCDKRSSGAQSASYARAPPHTQEDKSRVSAIGNAIVKCMLAERFAGPALKIAVNLKGAWRVIWQQLHIAMQPPYCDPAIMFWVMNPDGLETAPKTAESLYEKLESSTEVSNKGIPAGGDGMHACREVHFTLKVHPGLEKQLDKEKLRGHFENVEMALVPILGQMELDGIAVDVKKCEQQKLLLEKSQDSIKARAYVVAGQEFSMTNISDIRKEIQKLDPSMTATNRDVLLKLHEEGGHELPKLIVDFRRIERVITKDCSQLQRAKVSGLGGRRIQFSCNVFTATGRIAVNDPNLQNVPKPFEIDVTGGEKITVALREILVAREGCLLVAFDYHQIELRTIAVLSKDPELIDELNATGIDIFETMARALFKIDPAMCVTKDQRQKAKGACYGTMYGMGHQKLAADHKISENEAKKLLTAWKQKYSVATKWLESIKKDAKTTGFITMMSGRRRTFRAFTSRDKEKISKAERQAVNNLAQGSAADLVKLAMINVTHSIDSVSSGLSGRSQQPGVNDGGGGGGGTGAGGASSQAVVGPKARLILQIHDELLFEIPKVLLTAEYNAAEEIKQIMEGTPKQIDGIGSELRFPVRMEMGDSWGTLQAPSPAAVAK
jgi:DNA polymerase theta